MSGTKQGAAKSLQTNYTRYGDNFYKRIGSLGGSVKGVKKGFAIMDAQKHFKASSTGGSISKRKPSKPEWMED